MLWVDRALGVFRGTIGTLSFRPTQLAKRNDNRMCQSYVPKLGLAAEARACYSGLYSAYLELFLIKVNK